MSKTASPIAEAPKIPTGMPEGFVPTAPEGLTDAEAERLRAQGLGNEDLPDPGKTTGQIVRGHVFTLFNLLNVLLAVCLALVGSWRNMLFMGVVVSNTLIGVIQELRVHATIRRMQLLNAPTVQLTRGGVTRTAKSEELVRGDLIILHAGDQLPADCIVRGGSGSADESLLTGESDPVPKREGLWLMSGSFVTEGTLTAQVERAGRESYISQLSMTAKTIRPQKTQLAADLDRIIRVVSVALVPIGLLLFGKAWFLQHTPLTTAVTSSVAAMIGMIPEGLLLLTSVTLAVGVVKLARHQTMVQELHGIETLARVDVLCLDKTGTLTSGEMTLERLEPLDADEAELRAALSRFLGAFDSTGATMKALRREVEPGTEPAAQTVPFSSARKLSAARFSDGQVLVMGAATYVLGASYGGVTAKRVEARAASGLRVLVLCEAASLPEDGRDLPITRTLGLILLQDSLRDHCAETLAFFRDQGVDVRVISGDDPRTVAAVAARAGLSGSDRWVDASTLTTDDQVKDAAARYTVFGRVTPDRKCALVRALKEQGHIVAMTGDGVNDIPAMKASDCSIAMAGGSDAAKHAAQLTLLTSDFACMPMVVDEGRRVINNITRTASLYLVKTMYSFLLGLLMLVLPATYPFQPIQLTFISALTIGAPSFVLALQPNKERVRGGFLRTVLRNAVPGAVSVVVLACVCMLLERCGLPHETCSTLATLSAGAMGLNVLFCVCLPFDRLRAALFACMLIGFVGGTLLLGHIFYLTALTGSQLAILAGLILGGALLRWAIDRGMRRG